MPVSYHFKYPKFSLQKSIITNWIKNCISYYGFRTGEIAIVFVHNQFLFEMNEKYLNHHYNTDIITFNYNENSKISGDLFISAEQVKINAAFYSIEFNDELLRVIIHGVLHLIGFNDTTTDEKSKMREAEDLWLVNYKKL